MRNKYVLVVAIIHIDHGVGLEPCAHVSHLALNHTHWPQVRIVEVDLVHWVSPSIADTDTFQLDLCWGSPGLVDDYFSGESGDVMAAEGLAGDIQWGFLEHGPGFVEVVQEVEQVVSGLVGAWGLIFSVSVAGFEREADVEGLIDEKQMAEDVPGGMEEFGFALLDSDGSDFGVGSELWAGTRSTLKPDDEGNACRGFVAAEFVSHGGEETVVHSGGVLGEIPVDLFVAYAW